jgi:hypothetical protein
LCNTDAVGNNNKIVQLLSCPNAEISICPERKVAGGKPEELSKLPQLQLKISIESRLRTLYWKVNSNHRYRLVNSS